MNFQTQLEDITKEIQQLRDRISNLEKQLELLDHNFTSSYDEIKSKAEEEAGKREVNPIPFQKLVKLDLSKINHESVVKILNEILKI